MDYTFLQDAINPSTSLFHQSRKAVKIIPEILSQ
jgi:hypothetical protein